MYVYRWAWEDNENSKKSSYMYYKENIHYYMYKKTLFKPKKACQVYNTKHWFDLARVWK